MPADELAAARARISELEALEAQRERSERVQRALYRIAEAAGSAHDLAEFYRTIHGIVGELMYAENFYIALYDAERERMNYPYFVDVTDPDIPDPNAWEPFGVGQARGVTAYALRLGEPLIMDPAMYQRLIEAGEIEKLGVTTQDSSWLGVPLRAEGRTLGMLVVQSYSPEHQYTEADRDLLASVGQHVASALTRARAIEETRQRNEELGLVNEIGLALARQLDFGAIITLVGDRIRAIFQVETGGIALFDAASNTIAQPYFIDQGQRLSSASMPLGPGLTSHVITTGSPLRLNTSKESEGLGAIVVGSDEAESWLGVPILAGDRVLGVISLERVPPFAFSESDERLLSTLASSMGVALENARLFDETKRLLAETDARAAELAIVNTVQQGLAERVDIRSMYDLVGDKITEIFDVHGVDVERFDPTTRTIYFEYTVERGERLPAEPMELIGFRRQVVETRAPVLINRDLAGRAAEAGQPAVVAGELAKSALFVPMIAAGAVTGILLIENLELEDAFNDSDVRLLSTLAASLSVALENARLFDETRRLLQETDERAAELAVVNSVQQGLAEKLDMQAMYDLVGDKIAEIFDAQVVSISVVDAADGLIHCPYMIERGERLLDEPIAVGEGMTSLVLRTGEPLLVNDDVAGWQREHGIEAVVQGEAPGP